MRPTVGSWPQGVASADVKGGDSRGTEWRAPWRPSLWLVDGDHRPYRAPSTAERFHVYHQATLGAPWFRVRLDAEPLCLPMEITRETFQTFALAAGIRPGRCQLTPVDWRGDFVGQPAQPVAYPLP